MATTLGFFSDAGLTAPLAALQFLAQADTAAQLDRVIYLGSPATGKKIQAAANPGVAVIELSVADADAAAGLAPANVKLALSAANLETAVAGAPLALGAEILAGAASSLAVHVRLAAGALAAGNYADLSLVTTPVIEIDA